MSGAEAKWRRAMKALAIPPEILEAAPESPYGFPAAIWGRPPESVDSPSLVRALEALPEAGSVLDVGAGGGAASLALVPHVAHVTAVDESEALLEAFAANAEAAGVEHSAIIGRWPDVAPQAPSADVVVCHHVFYNALDLVAFASALTSHARSRVVAELTATHPLDGFSDLWRHFHGIDRPRGPDANDVIAVLAETGIEVQSERSERPSMWTNAPRSAVVGFVRRRLCLRPENDPQIDALIGDAPERTARNIVTLWWSSEASLHNGEAKANPPSRRGAQRGPG